MVQTSRITGVVEDGSNRSPKVPSWPARAVRLPVGGDGAIVMSVLMPGGSTPDLAGAVFRLSVQRTLGVAILGIDGAVQPDKTVLFAIAAAATRTFAPGRYLYDVWMTQNAKRVQVVPASALFLDPTVTPS